MRSPAALPAPILTTSPTAGTSWRRLALGRNSARRSVVRPVEAPERGTLPAASGQAPTAGAVGPPSVPSPSDVPPQQPSPQQTKPMSGAQASSSEDYHREMKKKLRQQRQAMSQRHMAARAQTFPAAVVPGPVTAPAAAATPTPTPPSTMPHWSAAAATPQPQHASATMPQAPRAPSAAAPRAGASPGHVMPTRSTGHGWIDPPPSLSRADPTPGAPMGAVTSAGPGSIPTERNVGVGGTTPAMPPPPTAVGPAGPFARPSRAQEPSAVQLSYGAREGSTVAATAPVSSPASVQQHGAQQVPSSRVVVVTGPQGARQVPPTATGQGQPPQRPPSQLPPQPPLQQQGPSRDPQAASLGARPHVQRPPLAGAPGPPPAAAAAAPAARAKVPKPPAPAALPSLLPGTRSKPKRGAAGRLASGPAAVIVSTRARSDGGVVVRSNRQARGDWYEPPPPNPYARLLSGAGPSSGQMYLGPPAGADPYRVPGRAAGDAFAAEAAAARLDVGEAVEPSERSEDLFLSDEEAAGPTPPAAAAEQALDTAAEEADKVAADPRAAAANLSPSAAAAAAAVAAAAAAAAERAKKKSTRPSAPWMSSFFAAGINGGSPAAVGVAKAGAGAAAASAAGSKQPTVDPAVLAAAMVKEASTRPALELSSTVTDLPAPIPELQARLEAAVQAEQESELQAMRALYASGSLRRLQREGVVLVGLTAAESGRLYRSALWRFSLMQTGDPRNRGGSGGGGGGGGALLPYNKFRPGANVIITRHEAQEEGSRRGRGEGAAGEVQAEAVDPATGLPTNGVEGVVVEAHKDHLVLALEGRSHEAFQAIVTAVAAQGPGTNDGRGRKAGKGAAGGDAPFLGWRLDLSVRDTTTRRHLDAIKRLGSWVEPPGDARLGEARVRAVLAGSRSAAVLAAEPPEWVKEGRWREDARAALAAQPGLNGSQRRAVAAALTRTVTLWQGPPGTGKTRTLLALIEVLVRVRRAGGDAQAPASAARSAARGSARRKAASVDAAPVSRSEAMGPILAVADTNAAVDNLVEGLAARGMSVVRLGPAAKARDSLRHLTLEAQAEATPAGRKAVALRTQALEKQEFWRKASRGAGQALKEGGPGLTAAAAAALMAGSSEGAVRMDLEAAETALRAAAAGVVAAADVVVSTCTSAGDSLLDGRPWRCVVLDEASQATEPSVLVALTRGSAFVVMAGDPRQLPPTVLSEAALRKGLDVTLFERVAVGGGVMPLLLDTQYRMHPAISAFPSAYFYGSKLNDGVEAADKPIPRGFPWPNASKPLAIINVASGQEETSGGMPEMAAMSVGGGSGGGSVLVPRTAAASKGQPQQQQGQSGGSGDRASYRNPREAFLALAVTQRLLAAGDITSAAILTPYRGQVRLVESLIRQRGLDVAWGSAGLEVDVSTVDGFQGREADVIIFSAVRANDRGAVGFLSDPRRMNVAITRPRRGLVVLAEPTTLTRGSADWSTYLKWAKSQGLIADESVIDVQETLGSAAVSPLTTTSSDDETTSAGDSDAASRGPTQTAKGGGTAVRASSSSSAPQEGATGALGPPDLAGSSSTSSAVAARPPQAAPAQVPTAEPEAPSETPGKATRRRRRGASTGDDSGSATAAYDGSDAELDTPEAAAVPKSSRRTRAKATAAAEVSGEGDAPPTEAGVVDTSPLSAERQEAGDSGGGIAEVMGNTAVKKSSRRTRAKAAAEDSSGEEGAAPAEEAPSAKTRRARSSKKAAAVAAEAAAAAAATALGGLEVDGTSDDGGARDVTGEVVEKKRVSRRKVKV